MPVIAVLSSCYNRTIRTSISDGEDILVTPYGIPVDYGVLGHVDVTKSRTANLKGLYQELGKECKKMGGNRVINIQADQET